MNYWPDSQYERPANALQLAGWRMRETILSCPTTSFHVAGLYFSVRGVRTSVAFSPDDKHIVGGGEDTAVRVWDAATTIESLTIRGHMRPVRCVAFSPDGRRIASGSQDYTVKCLDELKLRDAVSGLECLTLKGHTNGVISLAFSRDGRRIASGGGDSTVRVESPVLELVPPPREAK